MSPRGVAIPDLRERLFAAAERVVARDGAGALTSRAVTEEAGCGKGVLHTHFAGLDAFVAELVLDRFAATARRTETLPARAGQDTVAHNLLSAALTLLNSLDPGVVGLALTMPGASSHTRRAWEEGAPGFGVIEAAVAAYLAAEQNLGRVSADTDTAAAALAFVGTLHHLLMTRAPGSPSPEDRVERLVTLLVGR
ncbi:TetR/AcrR family transcriptional regulator [Streptomyces sp. NPDC054887]